MNPFKPDGRKSFAEHDKNFTKKVKKKLNYKHVGKADQFIIGSMLGRTESANIYGARRYCIPYALPLVRLGN